VSALHIADTGFFIALGDPSNERYQRVRTFAKRNEITFLVPERIYGELIGTENEEIDEARAIPIDVAINDGWVRVADPLEYTNPIVSKTMDGIQRYIANADGRLADEIERADPALGALAAQALSSGTTTHAYIYTTDIAAGEGAETVLGSKGYGDAVTFVNGFSFVDDLLEED
jgi:predicted nucleic acid-binding protein